MEYQSPKGHGKAITLVIILILALIAGMGFTIHARANRPASASGVGTSSSMPRRSTAHHRKAPHLTAWERNRMNLEGGYAESEGMNMDLDDAYPRLASEALYWLVQPDSEERTRQLSLRFKNVPYAKYGFARFPWNAPPFVPSTVNKTDDSIFECTTTVDTADHYTVTLRFERQPDHGWAITRMTASPGAIAAPNPEGA